MPKLENIQDNQMPKIKFSEIVFQYRESDSVAGVTRQSVLRMAKVLGMSEPEVIHYALRELAIRILPRYEQDDSPLNSEQMGQIRAMAPKTKLQSIRSTLF